MAATASTAALSAPNGRRYTPGQGGNLPWASAARRATTAALTPATAAVDGVGPWAVLSPVSAYLEAYRRQQKATMAHTTSKEMAAPAEAASPAPASSKRSADG